MKFLLKYNSLLSTGNGQERMGEITIESFAESEGYTIVEVPDEYLDVSVLDIVDGAFSLEAYQKRNNKENLKIELQSIQEWFLQNDGKPNKIIREEGTKEDPRGIEYLQESIVKRTRMDQINFILLG